MLVPTASVHGPSTTDRGGTLRHINQSELTTFTRCRRKWDWAYQRGLESPSYQSNLSTGSAVHAALQAHYRGEDPYAALTAYWAPIRTAIVEEDPSWGQLMKDVTLAAIMMEGYLEWLAETGVDAGLTPVAVEQKVEMLLTPDVTLHGTLDLVQVDEDASLWLTDHKTCASFTPYQDRRMVMNFQLLTYAVLCEDHFGQPPTGAIINMLRKVQRTGSAKPPFYGREMVHFNRHQLDAHRTHMLAILSDLVRVEEDGSGRSVYPVVDQDCTWKCSFLSVCALADDGSDIEGALNDLYVRRDKEHT